MHWHGNRGEIYKTVQIYCFTKVFLRDCISMCFDICTINIRVSIRVRGLHLVFLFSVVFFSAFALSDFQRSNVRFRLLLCRVFLAIMLLHVEKHVAGGAGMNFSCILVPHIIVWVFLFFLFLRPTSLHTTLSATFFSSYMRHLSTRGHCKHTTLSHTTL